VDPRIQRETVTACRRFNDRQIVTLSGKIIEIRAIESI
jgi:hypothetical protein